MKKLSGCFEIDAINYLDIAAQIAQYSTCLRSKCGSIIVRDYEIIGQGYNSPPKGETLEKCIKNSLPLEFKSDPTCCVHAEQRAIIDALRNNPDKIEGSSIYFIRLKGGKKVRSNEIYCTICSKLALDVGVKEWILWQDRGIISFNAKEYNKISFS